MTFINWGSETPEQIKLKRKLEEQELFQQAMAKKLFEQRAAAPAATASAAGTGTYSWQTVYDTAWIYPVADFNWTIQESNFNWNQEGNVLTFSNMTNLYGFVNDLWDRTTQTNNNEDGYSLGVGTVLRDKQTTFHLDLENGLRILTYMLMGQVTAQSDLPSGGTSPDGTIGYGVIYCDWDQNGEQDPNNPILPDYVDPNELGFGYGDPLRFVKI